MNEKSTKGFFDSHRGMTKGCGIMFFCAVVAYGILYMNNAKASDAEPVDSFPVTVYSDVADDQISIQEYSDESSGEKFAIIEWAGDTYRMVIVKTKSIIANLASDIQEQEGKDQPIVEEK